MYKRRNYDSIIQIYNKLGFGWHRITPVFTFQQRCYPVFIQISSACAFLLLTPPSISHFFPPPHHGLYQPLLVFTVLHVEVLPPKCGSNFPNNGASTHLGKDCIDQRTFTAPNAATYPNKFTLNNGFKDYWIIRALFIALRYPPLPSLPPYLPPSLHSSLPPSSLPPPYLPPSLSPSLVVLVLWKTNEGVMVITLKF